MNVLATVFLTRVYRYGYQELHETFRKRHYSMKRTVEAGVAECLAEPLRHVFEVCCQSRAPKVSKDI